MDGVEEVQSDGAEDREVGTTKQVEEEGVTDRKVETTKQVKTETYTITAYCPCYECSEGWGDSTASGVKAVEGITIATDKTIPLGTKIYIDGVGERIVQDRGGAIKGNKIDLYFDTHQEVLSFGRQTKRVTILKGE